LSNKIVASTGTQRFFQRLASKNVITNWWNVRTKKKETDTKAICRVAAISIASLGALVATLLLVPPIRDKVFTTKLWPWCLPWDTTTEELDRLKDLSQPGDVVIESNLHGWQWMALSMVTTGTSWVHAALVDENKQLLTVHKKVIAADWDIYLEWGSTRLALVRPPYQNKRQAHTAIDFARSKLGTVYDPSFREHTGNCNGLVASALMHSGIEMHARECYGRQIYPADSFFKITGARTVWSSNYNRPL
jgi:hypothetical protein